MSHQTGIRANEQLRIFFGKCRNGDVRLIKVSIQDEALALDEYREPIGTWEEDYDRLVLAMLQDEQPCFILYRLDSSEDTTGYQWLLITWSPDDSPVREKMMYASTKATLKLEFGGGQISDEFFATSMEDISLSAFQKHRRSQSSPAPLTFEEEELQKIKKMEVGVDIGIDTKHQTIQGVAFPISDAGIAALFEMRDKKLNYIQLSIDLAKEEINLESTQSTDTSQLPRRVPKDHARYHLFQFPHTHEGDYEESIFFIYSMPGYDCSVKERMLYSSCKSPLVEVIENKIGIPIAKRIEISEGKELTKDFLLNELHPPVNVYKPQFARPKGPPNRGAKRITKPNPVETNDGSAFV